MEKLRYILEDMVQWSEISREDADLIYTTVWNELQDKERAITKLIAEVTIAEQELERFKTAHPQLVVEANRKASNDAIILRWRLKKGKTNDSN